MERRRRSLLSGSDAFLETTCCPGVDAGVGEEACLCCGRDPGAVVVLGSSAFRAVPVREGVCPSRSPVAARDGACLSRNPVPGREGASPSRGPTPSSLVRASDESFVADVRRSASLSWEATVGVLAGAVGVLERSVGALPGAVAVRDGVPGPVSDPWPDETCFVLARSSVADGFLEAVVESARALGLSSPAADSRLVVSRRVGAREGVAGLASDPWADDLRLVPLLSSVVDGLRLAAVEPGGALREPSPGLDALLAVSRGVDAREGFLASRVESLRVPVREMVIRVTGAASGDL